MKNPGDIPLMILCGGKGTRLRDVTELLPKPMVAIGEQPIVWHIMKSYAAFGVRRFILCLGYKREAFVDYFMNYHLRTSDATIRLGHTPEITFHGESDEADWEVTLAYTGEESMTGYRVFKASRYLKDDDENFFLTYGDGVSDVNIDKLYKSHLKNNNTVTVTAVHPEARFGQMLLDGGVYNGRRLVSEGFIKEASMNHISTEMCEIPDKRLGYGYQFWMAREGAYRASGAYAQGCLVIPKYGIVITYTAWNGNLQGILDAIWDNIAAINS